MRRDGGGERKRAKGMGGMWGMYVHARAHACMLACRTHILNTTI